MAQTVKLLFRLICRVSSYGIGVATSAGISSTLAIIFGLYFVQATRFQVTDLMMNALIAGTIFAWIAHSLSFGILHQWGFSGLTRTVLTVNKLVDTRPQIHIKENLSAQQLTDLLTALTRIPVINSVVSVFWVQVILVMVLAAAYFSVNFNTEYVVRALTMDIIFSFIHGGFSLIIGEIATGEMRSECKKRLHDLNAPFENKAATTVRLKLAFFLLLFLITIYVSGNLVYYNRDNLGAIIMFTALALAAAILMAYLIFYLIYSSLKEIELAMHNLKEGKEGLLFTRSIDSEFVKVSEGINSAAITIADYRHHLEEKIEERTRELNESLSAVNVLKGQQDGDYFLTSLLLKPLSGNYSDNLTVKVAQFIKQKKAFEFRSKKNELGGDICISHTIRLRNRNFTMFLNGDAMGKSMQGAGGSLVLGAVLQSIIERTRLSSREQSLYPERWLKNAFIELQKTFESFDGSMLISVVLGLTDEQNGFTWFINAEHPWNVLFRDNKASFADNREVLRKIGTLGVEGLISVQTMQLCPGDTLVCGSDGRDDIMLTDSAGNRIMNEDETLFLRFVEEAQANLVNIHALIAKTGEITDDFSLISLTFQPTVAEPRRVLTAAPIREARRALREKNYAGAAAHLAQNAGQLDLKALKAAAWAGYRAHNYEQAAGFFGKLADEDPSDIKAILAGADCHRRAGKYAQAVDLAERIRIREPLNEQAVSILVKTCLRDGREQRAISVLQDFLKVNSDSPKLQAIYSGLLARFTDQ